MKTPAAGAVLPLALLLAGCIDFVELSGPGQEAEARAIVSVTLLDRPDGVAPHDSLLVNAEVFPGRDRNGDPRPFQDASLVVGERALPPVRPDDPVLRYEAGWEVQAGSLATAPLSVRLPVVRDQQFSPPVLVLSVPVRVGADTLRLAPGEPLVIRFRRPAGGDVPSEERWNLLLRRGVGYFSITSIAPLPDSLVVPREWIPADTATVMEAEIQFERLKYPDSQPNPVAFQARMLSTFFVRIDP